jgi:acyl-CoA thioester hydrolase
MLNHSTEIRIRYADTDQMKFVYNGKFFEYFEVGRAEMMREIGLTYKVIESKGFYMPVRETFIRFKNPAYYDELLVIESRVEKLPDIKVHIDHIIKSKERNVIVAEGYIELVFVNQKTNKVVRAPEFFIKAIKTNFNDANN